MASKSRADLIKFWKRNGKYEEGEAGEEEREGEGMVADLIDDMTSIIIIIIIIIMTIIRIISVVDIIIIIMYHRHRFL